MHRAIISLAYHHIPSTAKHQNPTKINSGWRTSRVHICTYIFCDSIAVITIAGVGDVTSGSKSAGGKLDNNSYSVWEVYFFFYRI